MQRRARQDISLFARSQRLATEIARDRQRLDLYWEETRNALDCARTERQHSRNVFGAMLLWVLAGMGVAIVSAVMIDLMRQSTLILAGVVVLNACVLIAFLLGRGVALGWLMGTSVDFFLVRGERSAHAIDVVKRKSSFERRNRAVD